MRSIALHRWREDRLPLLLLVVTFVIMSYPFVFRMHDSLALDSVDTHTALWQNWWMREAIGQGKNLNQSELLFHPTGLDITLQPRRWSSFPIWTVLYSLVGDPLAFNLTAMLGVLLKAYGMYLLGMTLFRRRIAAWVAAAFYAFCAPSLVLALQQPNTGATEWLPWFMLAWISALSRIRDGKGGRSDIGLMVLAGICFALNAYLNLKLAIFAMFLGGGYLVLFASASRLWSAPRLWLSLAAFLLSATLLTAPLLVTVLRSGYFVSAVYDPVGPTSYDGINVMSYLKADPWLPFNYSRSIASLGGPSLETRPQTIRMSQVGGVSLVFAAMGIVYAIRRDRQVLIWVILAAFFFVLSVGVVVRFIDTELDIYWTPSRLLQDVFFFRAIRFPLRWQLAFLFPLSILVGYGLCYRLSGLKLDRKQWTGLAVALGMLFYSTSLFPIPTRPAPRPDYLLALARLPEGAIVDLPLGRQMSKYYMSVQRFHRRPIAEGMIARLPPDAYDYHRASPMLSVFASPDIVERLSQHSEAEIVERMGMLANDGFRYLIIHAAVPTRTEALPGLPLDILETAVAPAPIYADETVRIYDISKWARPALLMRGGGRLHPPVDDELALRFGETILLHSWTLQDSVEAEPCQSIAVESWWQLSERDATPYTLSFILSEADGDGQLAITDKVPADRFTTEWSPGVFYRDQTAIKIPCTLADGSYPLLISMKESISGDPVPITSSDGNSIGAEYYLTTIHVKSG